ncbi:hypothetical protein Csp1_18720 [Corynebacterium provencense]|uniref:Uncharacterized protein n=1 Tax=Corynebacterium provencense TaxID=1737425 RepID=A0A2Z3YN70_9CORY|nr:hypothetical protein Csp1_18720 [Corynebacterium provencense]
MNAPQNMSSTTDLRRSASAPSKMSSRTIPASLPPSSRVSRLRLPALASTIRRPVDVDPVNRTFLIAGCPAITAPTSRSPGTTVRTPGGRTSLRTAHRASTDRVVFSDGFTITALPIRSAEAVCHTVIIIGQFHGPIAPTMPTGRHLRVARVPPSSTTVSTGTSRDAAVRSQLTHAPTSNLAFGPLSGLPVSLLSSSARGSATCSTASAAFSSRSARSPELQDAQSG